MRVGKDDFFHLTYCSNIHPGEQWAEVRANLEHYVPALRAALSPGQPFGIGLRLSALAVEALRDERQMEWLASWLADEDLYIYTLNGFPYGGFHRQVVKDDVYAPDWRTPERRIYSIQLAEFLAGVLPEDMDGGISTSPLSYKGWLESEDRPDAFHACSLNLAAVTAALFLIREETGKFIHIDIEPEPDCLIENTTETVRFFEDSLLQQGRDWLASHLSVTPSRAEDLLRDHIRLCYDTCHFAVAYEEPAQALDTFKAAGISIGKVQISAALKVFLPEDTGGRGAVAGLLQPFEESTYLHQVIERRTDGTLFHYGDLDRALPRIANPAAEEWRIHYHVPVFTDSFSDLRSTQADIIATLEKVTSEQICPHLEIETYTWDVLPAALKMDAASSIRREYEWTLSSLESISAKETAAG